MAVLDTAIFSVAKKKVPASSAGKMRKRSPGCRVKPDHGELGWPDALAQLFDSVLIFSCIAVSWSFIA